MKTKSQRKQAKELFQDYIELLKKALLSLDSQKYSFLNFYLRVNKFNGKFEITCNLPEIGGSSYAQFDIDFFTYKLPKVNCDEEIFENIEFLNLPQEAKESLILFAIESKQSEYIQLYTEYGSAESYINSFIFNLLYSIGEKGIQSIETVIKLLIQRIRIPRNLQYSNVARTYDRKIDKYLQIVF